MPGKSENLRLIQGNHACALGAVDAGCRFFAGYPITPSSEIAEHMASYLPGRDGIFIQMEDEIASMGAVLGASLGGAKVMTATSGPGFSLKQENLGYASIAEIPCVVVNVMRGGPSTGMPTRPSQGDVMQARWGTHGDHPVVVLVPDSVGEIYQQTVRAFNLAETLRTPVVLLYDEVVGHLLETISVKPPAAKQLAQRKAAQGKREDFLPYAHTDDGIPPMAEFGQGYRTHTTGLTHGPDGFPSQHPEVVSAFMERLLGKLDHHRELVDCWEKIDCDDAEWVVVAYGISARAARRAVAQARGEGIKAGLFRPITLWPFPEQALRDATQNARGMVVPEMNAGQIVLEVERLFAGRGPVVGVNRVDGQVVHPESILERLREVAHGN